MPDPRHITAHFLLLGLTILLALTTTPAGACNYGKYGLTPGDDSQATVDGLFQGKYATYDTWRADKWREAAALDKAAATDLPGQLGYAWSLLMAGQSREAFAIYQKLIQTHPDNYEVLCSYATALHADRKLPTAREVLQKAIKLKPGFRQGAEELHLNMLDHEIKSRASYTYARENLFIPQLTPIWKNRKGPDNNFATVEFPAGLSSKSIAELLRQYPNFGEGWLALAMLLEHEKDFSMAVKAYDRALDRGTAHKEDVKTYLATFREFGRAHDPGRVVGRAVVRLGIVLAGLIVALFLYRTLARVIWDVSSSRAAKQKQKRRERRKNDDGPLR